MSAVVQAQVERIERERATSDAAQPILDCVWGQICDWQKDITQCVVRMSKEDARKIRAALELQTGKTLLRLSVFGLKVEETGAPGSRPEVML